MIDVVFALALIGIVAGVSVAATGRAVSDVREAGAARAFAVRIRQVRAEAVRRSTVVGLQFVAAAVATGAAAGASDGSGVGGARQFRLHEDGNGNGLRTRDIAAGTDPPLAPAESLADASGSVRFALDPSVPVPSDDEPSGSGGDASGSASDSGGGSGSSGGGGGGSGGGGDAGGGPDPIRLGASDLLSFSPLGSATSGTIYLRGPTRQFAVRIYGPTGRVRLLEYRRERRAWVDR